MLLVGRQEGYPAVVICPQRGADLHMAQLMPLRFTVSGFIKIQTGHPGSHTVKGPLNACVCVCVCVCGGATDAAGLLITDWALRPSAYPSVTQSVGIRRCTPCVCAYRWIVTETLSTDHTQNPSPDPETQLSLLLRLEINVL